MEKHEMKELTRSEEQVMQAIWAVGQGFANEIVAAMEMRHSTVPIATTL